MGDTGGDIRTMNRRKGQPSLPSEGAEVIDMTEYSSRITSAKRSARKPAIVQQALGLILLRKLKALEAAKVAIDADRAAIAMAYAEACGNCADLVLVALENVKRKPMP